MATYVKGDAVANANSYELCEKSTEGTYTSLATNSEINFEVSAMGLAVGSHTLAVKAKADGYEDSDYSNEVTYTVAAQTFVDLDFTSKTVKDYIDDGILTAGDSTVDNLTYDSGGLVCNETDLMYGLKLATPFSVAQRWTIESTMTIAAYADSGSSVTEALYKNLAIFSNGSDHDSHANTCLAPVVMDNGLKGDLRLAEGVSTAVSFGNEFLHDGVEHTYKFTFDPTTGTAEMFVDETSVGTRTWDIGTTPPAGTFGYVLGIHKGYAYAGSYRTKAGFKIKTVKAYQ